MSPRAKRPGGVQAWARAPQQRAQPGSAARAKLPAGATQTVRDSMRELQRSAGNAAVRRVAGEPLDRDVRAEMEQRLGADLGHVRVHTDQDAAARADQLGAAAFARRADVAFAAGMYRPDTAAGRVVLAHELAHVIQQTRNAGSPALGAAALEAEADAAAAHGEPVLASAPPGTTQGVPASTQDDVLPVARFSPAPGLFVDRSEHSLSISGAMELYGPEANAARAASSRAIDQLDVDQGVSRRVHGHLCRHRDVSPPGCERRPRGPDPGGQDARTVTCQRRRDHAQRQRASGFQLDSGTRIRSCHRLEGPL